MRRKLLLIVLIIFFMVLCVGWLWLPSAATTWAGVQVQREIRATGLPAEHDTVITMTTGALRQILLDQQVHDEIMVQKVVDVAASADRSQSVIAATNNLSDTVGILAIGVIIGGVILILMLPKQSS